jgi:hypothetical protein
MEKVIPFLRYTTVMEVCPKIDLFVSLIKGNTDLSLPQDRLSLDLRVTMCIDGWSPKIRIKPKITKLPSRRLSWAQMRIF